MRKLLIIVAVSALALAAAAPASASRNVRYGIQDDAWLMHGPGSLEDRIAQLDALGVDLVRFTVRWDQVARRKPRNGRSHLDPAYNWSQPDAVLRGLRARGIAPLVTLLGSPRWANGGPAAPWAPPRGASFANLPFATQRRDLWGWGSPV